MLRRLTADDPRFRDLQRVEHLGFDVAPHLLSVRLNDRYDDGGLFGFRF